MFKSLTTISLRTVTKNETDHLTPSRLVTKKAKPSKTSSLEFTVQLCRFTTLQQFHRQVQAVESQQQLLSINNHNLITEARLSMETRVMQALADNFLTSWNFFSFFSFFLFPLTLPLFPHLQSGSCLSTLILSIKKKKDWFQHHITQRQQSDLSDSPSMLRKLPFRHNLPKKSTSSSTIPDSPTLPGRRFR